MYICHITLPPEQSFLCFFPSGSRSSTTWVKKHRSDEQTRCPQVGGELSKISWKCWHFLPSSALVPLSAVNLKKNSQPSSNWPTLNTLSFIFLPLGFPLLLRGPWFVESNRKSTRKHTLEVFFLPDAAIPSFDFLHLLLRLSLSRCQFSF